jgi:uncharacterized membrane protein YhaH (DUF805 family)
MTVLTKKYADFSGRARRSEYWFFSLATFLAGFVLRLLGLAIGNQFLYLIFSLAILVPGIAVGVRRLHDTGRSGWWLLIGFTVIGLIPLIIWFASDSTPGTNQYGPSPKGTDAALGQYGAGNAYGS